jgi:hypothetical protein
VSVSVEAPLPARLLDAASPAALLAALGMLALTPLVANTAGIDLAMFSLAFLVTAIVTSPASIGRSTAVLFPVFLTLPHGSRRGSRWWRRAASQSCRRGWRQRSSRWVPVP